MYQPLQARQWQRNVLLAKDLALGRSFALFAKDLAKKTGKNVSFATARDSKNAVHAMAKAKYKLGLLPYNDLSINV